MLNCAYSTIIIILEYMCVIWRWLRCVPHWNAFDGFFLFLLLKLLEKWKHYYTFLSAISSGWVLAQAVLVCSIYPWWLLGVCILHVTFLHLFRYKRLTVTLITISKHGPFGDCHCTSMEDQALSSSRDSYGLRGVPSFFRATFYQLLLALSYFFIFTDSSYRPITLLLIV